MSGLPCVIGIDGGATRTRYRLADEKGSIVGRSEGAATLLGAGDDLAVADRIIEEVRSMVSKTGTDAPLAVLFAGLAGAAARPDSVQIVRDRLLGVELAGVVHIVSDIEIAFHDAFGTDDGVLLIAGTGSAALGRTGSGRPVRVGGWGALIGDEGSGYWIGLEALRAAVRSAEDREVPTSLHERLFGALGVSSVEELYLWSCSVGKGSIAALAPEVVEEADRRDSVSERIVREAVRSLRRHAEALERRIDLGGAAAGRIPPVALVGGLIQPGGVLRDRLVQALEAAGFEVSAEPVEPVRGAVDQALHLLEV